MPDPLAGVLAGLVRLLERAGYLLANDVITYTPSMARELDLDPTSESVHPNGARYVDLDRFYPRTPFEDRDRVVGYLGRLDEEKGIRTLAAVAKHLPEDIRFRFIGDGDLRNWLETELESERAAGQVEVTGWVDHEDVPSELSSLQLLVMASEPTEGLPTTILEAMACGTPAYATSVSGVPDVVKEGETGYLMAEMDPESVAAEIASLLDSDELSSTSANARALITSSYDFDAARDRYEEIFSTLAA
ncbi:glycosyltransferase [Halovivax cerinus]|uniref:Glycosyltransferase n=1 Tax=Halovivax cerinus TaxID=1487865 RepID=A0ABD5NJ63_9EURY|nr:glycosyltransferase [Halovivax cerinus]